MCTGKDNQKASFNKASESLQAIVFADDFSHDLNLVQRVYSNILFPVVTTPLLNYIMETLIRSKVRQVFLYCSNHIDQIKSYVTSLKKHFENINEDSIVITPVYSEGCRSLGDALRDIDTKGWIRGDFILIRSNAFINMDLGSFMDLHKLRKEKDKNAVMTMVLRDLGSVKNSSLKKECSLVVSNVSNRKLLNYKKTLPDKKIGMELQWFLEHDKLKISSGLRDTYVYICSASVLPLFADNFDFQTMEDFIQGVLMNEEFLESRIYWEPLNNQAYALPISSWDSYRNLCRDILQRHTFPLVPDTLPYSLRKFIYMSRSTYKHSSSLLSKGCTIETESIIGQQSSLKENSIVTRSIIGPNCSIGANVEIQNSYLFSNIVIEDNSCIKDCIIFENCSVAQSKSLKKCILLPNVIVHETCATYENEYFKFIEGKTTITKLDRINKSTAVDSSFIISEHEDGNDTSSSSSLSRSSSQTSLSSDRESVVLQQEDADIFFSEVIDSLQRGYQEKLKCENLVLEINSSRYAYNISIRQVSYNVVKAILELPSHLIDSNDSKTNPSSYQKTLKSMLNFFQPILENYIKTEDAQKDCLHAIQSAATTNQNNILPYIQNLLLFLYNIDILSEEKILEWYEDEMDFENEHENNSIGFEEQNRISKAIKNVVTPFIKWLKEAEEDSS